jgi:sortase A
MALPPVHHQKKVRRNKIIKYLIIRTLSNFLILFALFGIGATFGPAIYFEAKFELAKAFSVHYKVAQTSKVPSEFGIIIKEMRRENPTAEKSLFDSILMGEKEKVLIPQSAEFSVVVPKIGANEKVYSNVDPNNEEEYLEVLRHGIAHAKGTAFPGLGGTTYLFAHSTDNFWNVGRYNAVFYLLNKMEKGDEITLFYNGKRFDYVVDDTKIVDPQDTHFIASNLSQGERVILQTCWPPGTAWKRLLVFAVPK